MEKTSLLQGRPAGAVNLIGGRLCLDFINSVGARRFSPSGRMTIRDEKLSDYLDLLVWGRHAGMLTDTEAETLESESHFRPQEAMAVFHRAIRLREAIYHICKAILTRKAPERSHLHLLNEELRLARGAEQLVFGELAFNWQWDTPDTLLDRPVLSIVRSAAELLTQGDLTRLHQCGGDDCGWIFEDTSRNRGRRWCDMRDCGNVAKVRRFRRRRQKSRMSHRKGVSVRT